MKLGSLLLDRRFVPRSYLVHFLKPYERAKEKRKEGTRDEGYSREKIVAIYTQKEVGRRDRGREEGGRE